MRAISSEFFFLRNGGRIARLFLIRSCVTKVRQKYTEEDTAGFLLYRVFDIFMFLCCYKIPLLKDAKITRRSARLTISGLKDRRLKVEENHEKKMFKVTRHFGVVVETKKPKESNERFLFCM